MSTSTLETPTDPAPQGSANVDEEGLVEHTRARVARALGDRELLPTVASAAAFVATTAALLLWLPSARPDAGLGIIIALVACYALAARVQFEVAFAYAVSTQLVFVPMLFLAPLELVPLLVALGIFLSKLPEHISGEWHLGRAGLHLVSSWYAVGPVLVLAAFGSPSPTLSNLPVVAVAVAAQFTFEFASTAARGFAALGIGPRELARAVGPAWLVDLALTPLGLALAYVSLTQSYAFLLGLPLMGLLAYFARERKSRINHALELSHAYRGTALLLGDVVEADDAYTGLHSQDVVTLVLNVADELGLDSKARREAEFTALLHDIGKVKIPKEIINKPGALTSGRAGDHQHPYDRGRADAGEDRRSARGRRPSRPLVPRALGRRRVSGRPRRRGDTTHRPHRLRLRCLQRDDDEPLLPEGRWHPPKSSTSARLCKYAIVEPGVVEALADIADRAQPQSQPLVSAA